MSQKTYDEIQIEKARRYFLIPLKTDDSLFYLGGPVKLQRLKIVMDASKVVATTGIQDPINPTCYILLDMTSQEVEDIMKKADETFKLGRPAKPLWK